MFGIQKIRDLRNPYANGRQLFKQNQAPGSDNPLQFGGSAYAITGGSADTRGDPRLLQKMISRLCRNH